MTDEQKTLKQQIYDFHPTHYDQYYDEIGYIINIIKKWLEQKRREEQASYDYLKPKAKEDIIHRTMWIASGAVLDFIDKKLLEELKQ